MGQSRPSLGGGQTGRETEQEKNIKEEGQEREKEREERLLERGARRSPACCQVPGFPSPLHKGTPAGLNWEGGSRETEGPFTKKALLSPFTGGLHTPTSTSWQQLESTIIPSSAIWHSSTSQLSSPLLLSYWCDTHEHTPRHKGSIMVHTTRWCRQRPRAHVGRPH